MNSLTQMLKDVAMRANLIKDYVISENTYPLQGADGLTGEWKETRWANGKMTLLGRFPFKSAVITTNMTAGVYSSNAWRGINLIFPNEFAEPPRGWANPQTSGYTMAQVYTSETGKASFRLWQSYSATLGSGYVDVYFVGKWK